MMLNFGAGDLYLTPLTDAYGATIANPTNVRVAGLQEFSLDASGDLKEFYGSGSFPLAVARGKVKIGGKFKAAVLDHRAINSMFFGAGSTAGTMRAIHKTASTAIPATPFQITPSAPSSGTFVVDLGVTDASGKAMTRVASSPATGQYAVTNLGAYTFASADAGTSVVISYEYSFTSAGSGKIDLLNLDMGNMPTLKLFYHGRFQNSRALVELSNIVIPKMGLLGTKNDDYSIPDIEYSAMADASGTTVGSIFLSE